MKTPHEPHGPRSAPGDVELPRRPVDPAWKKVKWGLQLMFTGLVGPMAVAAVAFPVGCCLSALPLPAQWLLPVVSVCLICLLVVGLSAFPICYAAGCALGVAIPDARAKGFQTGAGLCMLVEIGSVAFWAYHTRNAAVAPPKLALLGLWLMMTLVGLNWLIFSALYLRIVARMLAADRLAKNCLDWLYFSAAWVWLLILMGIAAELNLGDGGVGSRLLIQLAALTSYFWYPTLLHRAWETIENKSAE